MSHVSNFTIWPLVWIMPFLWITGRSLDHIDEHGEDEFLSIKARRPKHFHAVIVHEGKYCSGALISSRAVVTVATCFPNPKPQPTTVVKVGSETITGPGDIIPVIAIKIHEYYNYQSASDNDIAIAFLKRSVSFQNSEKILLMTYEDKAIEPKSRIEVVSWTPKAAEFGRRRMSTSSPKRKGETLTYIRTIRPTWDVQARQMQHRRYSVMYYSSPEQCRSTFRNIFMSTTFCALYTAGNELTDIGSPAVYKDRLIGLAVYDYKQTPMSALFTNITPYYKWLEKNIEYLYINHCKPVPFNDQSEYDEFYDTKEDYGEMGLDQSLNEPMNYSNYS